MKSLLRLYPRAWRKRYGREMEILLEDLPRGVGVGLDLVLGAGAAYAAVVRGNRILSAFGTFLHGVCVAVLLQAIAFVTFILVGLGTNASTDLSIGPIHLATFLRSTGFFGERLDLVAGQLPPTTLLPSAVVLAILLGALVLLLVAPRWVRTPAQ